MTVVKPQEAEPSDCVASDVSRIKFHLDNDGSDSTGRNESAPDHAGCYKKRDLVFNVPKALEVPTRRSHCPDPSFHPPCLFLQRGCCGSSASRCCPYGRRRIAAGRCHPGKIRCNRACWQKKSRPTAGYSSRGSPDNCRRCWSSGCWR